MSTYKVQNGLVVFQNRGWMTIRGAVLFKLIYGSSKGRYDLVSVSGHKDNHKNVSAYN